MRRIIHTWRIIKLDTPLPPQKRPIMDIQQAIKEVNNRKKLYHGRTGLRLELNMGHDINISREWDNSGSGIHSLPQQGWEIDDE